MAWNDLYAQDDVPHTSFLYSRAFDFRKIPTGPRFSFSPSYKFHGIQEAFGRLRDIYWHRLEGHQRDSDWEEDSDSMEWTHFEVTIDRNSIIESSLNAFTSLVRSRKWHALKVRWAMEDVDDLGGPFKEWVTLLTDQILNLANNVVERHPEFNVEAQKHGLLRLSTSGAKGVALVQTLGYAVGLAFANDVCIKLPFPLFMFRALCSVKGAKDAQDFRWTLKDLEDVDQDLMFRLHDFMRDSIGPHAARDIASDVGLSIPVTAQSENAIKEIIFQHRIEQTLLGDPTAFRHFIESFMTVVRGAPEPTLPVTPLLSTLLPVEMRAMITGASIRPSDSALDLCSVEALVHHHGFEKDNEMDTALKMEFWRIFRAYDGDQQQRLLAFITGSKQLSYKWQIKLRGQESSAIVHKQEDEHPFTLHLVDDPASRMNLPWSSTCTATLFIPRIPSSELKPRLDLSLQHYTGFGLL